ncbi:MAG: nucleotidyltransferase domain-containing protein [Deltaproteobacteria bacterium]|nr:nucleotidyltransferase domain-containing protein [Deltaproteobacteria bacterium]
MGTTSADTASWLRARDAARWSAAAERSARLRRGLPAVAAELIARLGCSRVVLFGSLARGDVHPQSDVDLWVEGLDAVRQFEVVAAASARLGVQVDLVRAEEAPPSLRERVQAEGVPL